MRPTRRRGGRERRKSLANELLRFYRRLLCARKCLLVATKCYKATVRAPHSLHQRCDQLTRLLALQKALLVGAGSNGTLSPQLQAYFSLLDTSTECPPAPGATSASAGELVGLQQLPPNARVPPPPDLSSSRLQQLAHPQGGFINGLRRQVIWGTASVELEQQRSSSSELEVLDARGRSRCEARQASCAYRSFIRKSKELTINRRSSSSSCGATYPLAPFMAARGARTLHCGDVAAMAEELNDLGLSRSSTAFVQPQRCVPFSC